MRAIRVTRFGGPEVFEAVDVPQPVPGEGEVLVRVTAAGVNPVDGKIMSGAFPATVLPRIPGLDFAGEVAAGEGFAPGTRVFGSVAGAGIVRDGTFAQFLVVAASACARSPDGLDPLVAASLGVPWLTASMALEDATRPAAESWLVVHGASGGVGHACVVLGAAAGARVLAITRGEASCSRARAAGAEITVDRGHEDVWEAIRRHTGNAGAATIVDTVGGAVFERSLDVLAPFGCLVTLGVSAGTTSRVSFDLAAFYRANRRIVGVGTMALGPAERVRRLERIGALLASGSGAPQALTVLPLDHARDAIEALARPEGAGTKFVLRCA